MFTQDKIWRLERILGEMCRGRKCKLIGSCRPDIYLLDNFVAPPLWVTVEKFIARIWPLKIKHFSTLILRIIKLSSKITQQDGGRGRITIYRPESFPLQGHHTRLLSSHSLSVLIYLPSFPILEFEPCTYLSSLSSGFL